MKLLLETLCWFSTNDLTKSGIVTVDIQMVYITECVEVFQDLTLTNI